MNIRLLSDAEYNAQQHTAGDELVVDGAVGTAWCHAGIALDLSGAVPTAPVTLEVQNGQIGATSERI
jgi:hypothetical protein